MLDKDGYFVYSVEELIDRLNQIEDKHREVWVCSRDEELPCQLLLDDEYPYVLLS